MREAYAWIEGIREKKKEKERIIKRKERMRLQPSTTSRWGVKKNINSAGVGPHSISCF